MHAKAYSLIPTPTPCIRASRPFPAPSSRPGRAKKVARIPGAACRGAG